MEEALSLGDLHEHEEEGKAQMADVNLIKNVASGLSEYVACESLSANDSLSFEFNQEITVDDIVLDSVGEGTTYDVYFLYPASGQKGYILYNIPISSWFLNAVDNLAGKLWYHLPVRTKLVFVPSTSATIKVTVVGRSG